MTRPDSVLHTLKSRSDLETYVDRELSYLEIALNFCGSEHTQAAVDCRQDIPVSKMTEFMSASSLSGKLSLYDAVRRASGMPISRDTLDLSSGRKLVFSELTSQEYFRKALADDTGFVEVKENYLNYSLFAGFLAVVGGFALKSFKFFAGFGLASAACYLFGQSSSQQPVIDASFE